MALTEDAPNSRFQEHVSFDNFAGGEATEKNSISFTLNVKHKGYQYKRRSRTFMVGIDENDYSDIALQWMLEELVDDGDEIVCLRVIEKDAKIVSDKNVERRQYQIEARELMGRIQARNDANRAISIVLEFAVGKIHATFEKMIQLYEPAMLIVGTRGRSLGGFQGLVGSRNSFSKWCLQYSPVPVVVVRPTEKREKKKKKRDADPTRQDYARILRDSGVEVHETGATSRTGIFEAPNTPDVEAIAVAAALGLPVEFSHLDERPLKKVESTKSEKSDASSSQESMSPLSAPSSPGMVMKLPKSEDSGSMSGEDSSDDEEGEFEAISGDALLGNSTEHHPDPEEEKKKKLHEMEVGEAASLLSGRKVSVESVESMLSEPGGASIHENGENGEKDIEEGNDIEEGKDNDDNDVTEAR